MWRPRLLLVLWILFLLRGLFYVSFVPLWEGFDEWAHYAVIQSLVTGGHLLIGRSERVSREVQASLELVPSHSGAVDEAANQRTYWHLPAADRSIREARLRALPPQWAREAASGGAFIYEAQQAPLYYWLFAPVYRLTTGVSFLARVWLLRWFSLLIASAVVPLAWLVSREIGHPDPLGVTALVVSLPQLTMTVAHIGNDSLAIAIGSLLLLVLFRWKKEPSSMSRALALGAVFGLALLTKAYFIALVPPVFLFIGIWARRRNVWRQAAVIVACIFALSAWWYVRTWLLTHSLSGEQVEAAGSKAGLTLLAAIPKINWWRALDFNFFSHIWLSNWSFLVVRSWMYHLLALFAGLAAIGVVVRLISRRKAAILKPDILLLAGIYSTFALALGYQAARGFQSTRTPGALGHYLFCIVVAEAILVTIGLEAIVPAALTPMVILGGVVCFAGIEFFGMHFYSLAFYSGFTECLSNGSVPALNIDHLRRGGLATMFARLAMNKPEFLTATIIESLWVLYLVSTCFLIIIAARLAWLRLSSYRGDAP